MTDSQPKPFQFSIFNLMLAMVPLAVMTAGLCSAARHQDLNWFIALPIFYCLVAAGGALFGGFRGTLRWLWYAFSWFGLFLILACCIGAVWYVLHSMFDS